MKYVILFGSLLVLTVAVWSQPIDIEEDGVPANPEATGKMR